MYIYIHDIVHVYKLFSLSLSVCVCVCVVIQPIINQTVSYTVTVTYFCDVEDESPGLSFVWERLVGSAVVDLNDTRITGVDTNRLQIGNVGRNDAGVYRCTIFNDDSISGFVDSEDTFLTAEGIYIHVWYRLCILPVFL